MEEASSCWHLDFELLASRTEITNFYCFKPLKEVTETIHKFSKATGYKVNVQEANVFLHINN